jgi:predicted DNA-binding protein YlxM (UPF0122 family)
MRNKAYAKKYGYHMTIEALLKTLETLPKGQQRAIQALLDCPKARTYAEAAEVMGVSIGSLYQHLKRVRDKNPELYQRLMFFRKQQLEQRHREALARDQEHSQKWFRKKRNRAYFYRHGFWPWEYYLYRKPKKP